MKLTEQQLFEHLKDALQDDIELDADSELLSTGVLDSVGMMQLIMFVEETAGIQVRHEDVTLDNFDTVGRIMRFVQEQA